MAETATENFLSERILIKSSAEFEISVREKLKWDKSKWTAVGLSGTKMNKLCNSANYWKFKLKAALEDTGIIITLFNERNDVLISLSSIVGAIENLKLNVSILGFTNFRNPRYIAVYFKNKEEKERVMQSFKMIEDSFVFYLSWALDGQEVTRSLKAHWVPVTLDVKVIEKELNEYVECVEHERQVITLMSGKDYAGGKVNFKVKVKENVKVETIPHIIIINGLEILITISGRLPLCLSCEKLGHISRECEMRFCNVCKNLSAKEHVCTTNGAGSSYADIVKSGSVGIQPDDWGDSIVVEQVKDDSVSKDSLEKKIIGLEQQIISLQSEEACNMKDRLEHKRKADEIDNLNNIVGEVSSNEISVSSSSDESLLEEEDESVFNIDNDVDFTIGNLVEKESYHEFKTALKNKRKKKKKRTVSKPEVIVKEVDTDDSTRSYGKPNFDNIRRRKENAAIQKLMNKDPENREFMFKD